MYSAVIFSLPLSPSPPPLHLFIPLNHTLPPPSTPSFAHLSPHLLILLPPPLPLFLLRHSLLHLHPYILAPPLAHPTSQDPKLTRWCHETLLQVLDTSLLPIYLDILQVLKAKCPVLVEHMIHSSMNMVGGEAFALLLKRPWNPAVGLYATEKQVRLPLWHYIEGNVVRHRRDAHTLTGNFESLL